MRRTLPLALLLSGCLARPPVQTGPGATGSPTALQSAPRPELAIGPVEAMARPEPADTAVASSEGSSGGAVPGELIVGRDAGAVLPEFPAAEIMQTYPFARAYDLVRVEPGREAEAMAFYGAAPGVTSVTLNRYVEPHAIPANDPLLAYNWQYGPNRADVYAGWAEIDASLASGLASTVVAVIDSGVDPNHPDLSPNVLSGYLTTPALGKTNPPAGSSFDPGADPHGTLVAGVVGAAKNNAIGGAGVAPGAKILPLKDLDPVLGRITTSGLLGAITIATFYNQADSPFTWLQGTGNGQPVSVINISQGIQGSFGVQAAYQDAIDLAVAHGISVVVSAGNEATDVTVPANSPGAIAVGVTMRYLGWELLAPYSNHGDAVWVTGPANMIWSTTRSSGGDYTRAYSLFNGTSAAAPFVSGVCALVYAKYVGLQTRNRALAAKVREKLRGATDDLGSPGWDPLYGWGRVNVKKALQGSF